MNKLVSVVIPTYNSGLYIKEAVDSVLRQSYKNFEIIVVDDGSIDDTKSILSQYIKTGKIKYLFQENKGPAVARNSGIKHSKGEFVAFLDADDIWQDDKLEKQLPLFSDTDVSLVYSDTLFFGDFFSFKSHLEMAGKFYRGKALTFLIKNNFIPTSSVVIRRSILEKIGHFNESVKLEVGEDYELWLRIASFSKIDFINESLVKHRIHKNQISIDRLKTYRSLLFLYKNFLINKSFKSQRLLLFQQYFKQKIKLLFLKIYYD